MSKLDSATPRFPPIQPVFVGADWPQFGHVDDVRPALARIVESREAGALATLVRTEGPSPRGMGAQMAIAANGDVVGFLSGGCVEANVALLGLEVAHLGPPRLAAFGAGSPYFDVRLVCGARIEIFIERIAPDDASIEALMKAHAERRSVTRVTQNCGAARIISPAHANEIVGIDESGSMWRVYDPSTRIVVIGRDPVALATAQLAMISGFDVALVCPRGPAPPPPFASGMQYFPVSVAEAFESLKPDPWTAIVTLTHDLETDNDVLIRAFQSRAFYVGALGSRRRRPDRIRLLLESGFPEDVISRLHTPVGLDIGAASPMEIAISILAGVIRAFRKS